MPKKRQLNFSVHEDAYANFSRVAEADHLTPNDRDPRNDPHIEDIL